MNRTAFSLLVALALALAGCSSYGHKVAPLILPEQSRNAVSAGRALITARAFLDRKEAERYFGFDIRKAGLLPVQVVIDNRDDRPVSIDPAQTFLIDGQGQAWPVLGEKEAYRRIEETVKLGEISKGAARPALVAGAAGALIGFAVGIVSGHDVGENIARGAAIGATAGAVTGGAKAGAEVGERIGSDLQDRSLRNVPVEPHTLAHGFLFFPGKGEADGAVRLRLGLSIGDSRQIVDISLLRQ